MDYKRDGEFDEELDIQALLDKYLPDEQNDEGSEDAGGGLAVSEEDYIPEEVSFPDHIDLKSIDEIRGTSEPSQDTDPADDNDFKIDDSYAPFYQDDSGFVMNGGDPDSEGFRFYDDASEYAGNNAVSTDYDLPDADGYDAYGEFAEAMDTVMGGESENAAETPAEDSAKTFRSAADAVLGLGDDELVIDQDIIAELMSSDDVQFGGIEGFENIEDLSGFDITSSGNAVSDAPARAEGGQVEYSEEFEHDHEEPVKEEVGDDFVGETINELDSEKYGEADMDFLVAFGLEDELGNRVGEKKASRLKKNYEKVVEKREEQDRKSVQNEYRDPSQNGEISSYYKKLYSRSKLKILLTGIFALLLLIYENLPLIGLQLSSFLDPAVYPVVYVMIDLQILLLAVAVVYEQVFRGFARLFTGRPSPETILSVSALVAIVYSIVAAKSAVPPTEPNLFNFPVAFCAFMTAVFSYLTVKREVFSFNVVSSKKPKYALRRLSASDAVMEAAAFGGEDEVGDILKIEKVSFVDGYFYRTGTSNSSNAIVIFVCLGLSLILAALFGVYSAMMNHSASGSFMLGYAAFVTILPASVLFTYSYPFFKANSVSYDVDSTIVGESSLEEYSGASVMSFDDKLVFPSIGVKVQNLKVYNNYRFDRVLYYAASVFTKTGGPLSDVFELATVETGYSDDVLLTGIGDGYLQTEVDGKSIMFGKAENLRDFGVEISEDITDEDEEEPDVSVMYMVFKGKLVAKMNILYSLDSDFEYIVKQLAGSGMSVCVKTLDPNIDEAMIKSRVKLDKYPMRVIRYSSLEEAAGVVERSDSGVVARGTSKGLLETVTFCDKVLEAKRTNSFICLIQTIVSVVILAIILLSGNIDGVRSFFSVLLQAFWLIPMAFVTKALLR
ncbi:MAG: hypothetical protein IJT70_03820 [Clostridia bacterium]|nr:hypothetical protein [Clostridia bacterium]